MMMIILLHLLDLYNPQEIAIRVKKMVIGEWNEGRKYYSDQVASGEEMRLTQSSLVDEIIIMRSLMMRMNLTVQVFQDFGFFERDEVFLN